MKNNNSGKVFTVFLIIIAILLVSLTAISFFFFQQETQMRKGAELKLENTRKEKQVTEEELAKAKKQNFLLEEKNKEADERINSLLDELELEKGLKDKAKAENTSLKEQLDKEAGDKKELQDKLADNIAGFEQKIADLNNQLESQLNAKKELEAANQQLQEKIAQLTQDLESLKTQGTTTTEPPSTGSGTTPSSSAVKPDSTSLNVELDTIVVSPGTKLDGRILMIDADSNFVILSLGEKDGIKPESILSIFRGDEYLGDVKVNRVQMEMSAADLIPPCSISMIKQNDRVVLKK